MIRVVRFYWDQESVLELFVDCDECCFVKAILFNTVW